MDCFINCHGKALSKAELNENQWIAILCLTYNIDSGGFASSSVLRSINQGDNVDTIEANMKKWCKGTINGTPTVLPGLADGRQVEFETYSDKLDIEKDTTLRCQAQDGRAAQGKEEIKRKRVNQGITCRCF